MHNIYKWTFAALILVLWLLSDDAARYTAPRNVLDISLPLKGSIKELAQSTRVDRPRLKRGANYQERFCPYATASTNIRLKKMH